MTMQKQRLGYPKLRGIIAEKGLKQNYLATELGIGRTTLSMKLNGNRDRDFTLEEAYKLSKILDVTVDDFF